MLVYFIRIVLNFYELEKIYILTELTICEKVYFNICSDLYMKP